MGAVVGLVSISAFALAGNATVYYGELEGAEKPSVLVARKVFERIPEYREIKRRGLDEDDPDYWILLSKANEKFYAAVRKVAEREGYDVVVEKGSHEFDPEPPDITQAVIDELE